MAKGLADLCSVPAITRYLENSQLLSGHFLGNSRVLDHFSAMAHGRHQFHSDVLEAVFSKVHSPVIAQQNLRTCHGDTLREC